MGQTLHQIEGTNGEQVSAQLGDITVNGSRGYLFGSTIDNAGIWVGETGDAIKQGVGQFIQDHPGVGIALTLADGAFAVVAPVKYLGGMALDLFKDEASGYIADKMTGPQLWSVQKGQAGGSGFVLAGNLALSGIAALRGGATVYRGGAYGRLSAGPGIERHHLPADSVSPYTRYSGPAIQMDKSDHLLTSSHGSQGLEGALYSNEIKKLIDDGQIRGAMAREIWDVRRAAVQGGGSSSKYNGAIREMLDYSYGKGWLDR